MAEYIIAKNQISYYLKYMIKQFVLDTNVFLHNPHSLFDSADNFETHSILK